MDSRIDVINPLLRMAVIAGVETAVKHHIKRGDNLDARDSKGATALMLAVGRKKISVAQLLVAAGANPSLIDHEGRDALAYAKKTGCDRCASLIHEALAAMRSFSREDHIAQQPPTIEVISVPTVITPPIIAPDLPREALSDKPELAIKETDPIKLPAGPKANLAQEPQERTKEAAVEVTKALFHLAASSAAKPHASLRTPDLENVDLDDLDDWEVEPEAFAPQGDDKVAQEARVLHETIKLHQAIDGDESWDDLDLFLPDRALPLLRNNDGGSNVRNLLFRAIREGSVPESALINACLKVDESRNEEAEKLLAFVIGDLGAVIDDQLEIKDSSSFGEPTSSEDLEIAEAIEFAEDLASGRNDPLRIYLNLKQFRGDLLQAQEEIALSREIEEGGLEALDALSRWPAGLASVFDAADKVACGEVDVEAFSSGAEPSEECETKTPDVLLDEIDEVTLDQDVVAFISAISHVKSLNRDDVVHIRAALATARLSRGFMLELAKKAGDDPFGILFASAVRRQAIARERMICSNLRLAYSIAKKYQWSTEALDDLVQEANIGLMKAVERFDWRKGFRFSTYATWWIRQQIARAIADKARVIRVPVHLQDTVRKLLLEREAFKAKEGRDESESESSLRTGIPLVKIRHLLNIFEDVYSLDVPNPELEVSRVDLLIDTNSPDPAAVIEAESVRRVLSEIVGELDERSAKIISLRFGLAGADEMTLEEVGQGFNVTRERIRQIEVKAIEKLSRKVKKELEAFTDDKPVNQVTNTPSASQPKQSYSADSPER
ncbi:sigma-70 family RNA polymerase sigma factor [Pseudomonas luteola]|uniref:sigma-70 family RNA polymerase sigma factor n=1 Tax=Pseudomonas luteola TaxID=47886 RepID=UPI00289E7731|nr:sigma-70 family RNA polymerase sigma factor [Pseudomonas luteola]